MSRSWKRLLSPALAGLFAVVSLAGCGSTEPKEEAKTAVAAQTQAPAPTVDKDTVIKDAVVSYFKTIPATNHQIASADLKKQLDANPGSVYVLDIRKAEDFAKGHIDGAINVPFTQVGANLDKLPKDKQIAVACYTGQTAGQTISVLRLAGYNAVAVKFGMQGWNEAKLPVVQ